MGDAAAAIAALAAAHAADDAVAQGQMFGKACLLVAGKAFLALHRDRLAFKLEGEAHARALALDQAALWDPSGCSRPMKAWVAVPCAARAHYAALAVAARDQVARGA